MRWLKEAYSPKLILRYSSYTTDDWVTDRSDVDLLTVAEGLKATPYENYVALKSEGLIEPLGYAPEAFLKTLANLRSLILLDAHLPGFSASTQRPIR